MGVFSSLAAGIGGAMGGLMGGGSSQGRSGFAGVNQKLDQLIEMQGSGGDGGAAPIPPSPVPVGNLGGNLAEPSGGGGLLGQLGVDPMGGGPVPMPDIQNAGGGGLAPVGGGMDPIAEATGGGQYQMPQNRSFI